MSDIGIGTIGAPTVNNEFQSEALQNLDKDAFLELLVAQMRYQNPMSPVDSQQYLAQAAQYASVEQLENMASSQAELRSMQMVSIATDLVGKEITALDSFTGQAVTGVVSGVRFGTEPILIVDGAEVALSAVISVGQTPGAGGTEDEPTVDLDADADDTAVDSDSSAESESGVIQENDVPRDDATVDSFDVPVGTLDEPA